MSTTAALPPAPSPTPSSVAVGAASVATTPTMSSPATSSRGTAGASPPTAPSTASSVFSAPTWWPPFGRRTAAPATVTPSGATAIMIAPRGSGGGGGGGGSSAAPSRHPIEPPGVVGSGEAASMPRRQLNPTLPSLRKSSTNSTDNRSSGGGGGGGGGEGDRSNVAEARVALEASMANILDRELVPRAQALHAGERVITRQQADVARATASLHQTNQQLARVVEDASWKLRELGHLQNWTEMMERRFLTVEETLRLVREGGGSGDEQESCSSCRCSECCSDCGRSSPDGSDAGGDRTGPIEEGPGADAKIDDSMDEAGESSTSGFQSGAVPADIPASSQAGPLPSNAGPEPSTHAIKEGGVLTLAQTGVPAGFCQVPFPKDPKEPPPPTNLLDVDPSQVPLPAETGSLFEYDRMAAADRPA